MENFVWYYPEGHTAHRERGHPERPERIEAIRAALQEIGWWDAYPKLPTKEVPRAVLEGIHSPAYLNVLEMTCRRGGRLDADTYTTPASWTLALQAAGGALAVAEAVWCAEARRGFALTRPPGHHAMRGQGMGFCLLNNIALAVEYLVQNFGARRLAIIDLDLHHGNGTQDIFWQRKDVFYISTHQSPLYPHSGFLHETGGGDAKGTNANFPFPPGSGDQAFRVVMNELILPLLNNFAPQMLLVSYGFDTHWSDPLGSLLLSAAGYAELIQSLADWADEHCQGRIAIFLEGGYNLEAAAACTQGVTAALLGYLAPNRVESVGATPAGRQIAWEDPLGPYPGRESQAWQGMVEKARQIWSDRLSFN